MSDDYYTVFIIALTCSLHITTPLCGPCCAMYCTRSIWIVDIHLLALAGSYARTKVIIPAKHEPANMRSESNLVSRSHTLANTLTKLPDFTFTLAAMAPKVGFLGRFFHRRGIFFKLTVNKTREHLGK
jgi:hypothetical protein